MPSQTTGRRRRARAPSERSADNFKTCCTRQNQTFLYILLIMSSNLSSNLTSSHALSTSPLALSPAPDHSNLACLACCVPFAFGEKPAEARPSPEPELETLAAPRRSPPAQGNAPTNFAGSRYADTGVRGVCACDDAHPSSDHVRLGEDSAAMVLARVKPRWRATGAGEWSIRAPAEMFHHT